VEAEEDDFWFRGFNMRTGERGVFPAFYAHAVPGPAKDLLGKVPPIRGSLPPQTSPYINLRLCDFLSLPPPGSKRSPCWVDRFDVQFLGSVEVPCHQGNGILCAAMQKVSVETVAGTGWRPS
jgi:mitogen-activated protein kinase 8 interacting protein 2